MTTLRKARFLFYFFSSLFLFVKFNFKWPNHGNWLVGWLILWLCFVLLCGWSSLGPRKWLGSGSTSRAKQRTSRRMILYIQVPISPPELILFVSLFDQEICLLSQKCTTSVPLNLMFFLAFHGNYYPIKPCPEFVFTSMESIKDSIFILCYSLFPQFSLQPNKAEVYILLFSTSDLPFLVLVSCTNSRLRFFPLISFIECFDNYLFRRWSGIQDQLLRERALHNKEE